MTSFAPTSSVVTSGLPSSSSDVDAYIAHSIPFLTQAAVLALATVFELPDPADLCEGKRQEFSFYVLAVGGIGIQATAGAQIRIGGSVSSVNGQALGTTVGDYLKLVALTDTLWGAVAEVPDGSWTLA